MVNELEYSLEEKLSEKLLRKAIDQPVLPIGFAAIAIICGYGAYSYKRKTIKTSLFLIHYRVAAQGTFIGCLAIALTYSMFKKHIWDKGSKKKLEES